MTRPISSTILAEYESEMFRPFLLIKFSINNVDYRYTNCDVPIKYDGELYYPFPFKVGDVQYSINDMVDSVNITFDNVGLQLYSAFVGQDAQREAFSLIAIVLDDSYQIIDEENTHVIFSGFIDEWSIEEMVLDVTIVSIFTTWKQKTLSRHPASCRWKVFKEKECKYTGDEALCDRSYARCLELQNTDNFGGFRHLPDLEDKELWWGRLPG